MENRNTHFLGYYPLAPKPCNSVTDYDGNEYRAVQIGSQCWMAENLRTTHYSNGTSIPQGSSASSTTGYWYYPDGDSNNARKYGLLYNWPAVMDGATSSNSSPSGVRGICPQGWNTSSTTCEVGDTPANNNATGFSAVPAGYYGSDGCGSFGYAANFWSATQSDSTNAYNRYLGYNAAYVSSYIDDKNYGFSVRCLRD